MPIHGSPEPNAHWRDRPRESLAGAPHRLVLAYAFACVFLFIDGVTVLMDHRSLPAVLGGTVALAGGGVLVSISVVYIRRPVVRSLSRVRRTKNTNR